MRECDPGVEIGPKGHPVAQDATQRSHKERKRVKNNKRGVILDVIWEVCWVMWRLKSVPVALCIYFLDSFWDIWRHKVRHSGLFELLFGTLFGTLKKNRKRNDTRVAGYGIRPRRRMFREGQ